MGLNFLGRERRRAVTAGALHVLGSMVGGAAVGAILGIAGSWLDLDRWRLWIVAGAALVVLGLTLTRDHFEFGRPCQVPREWTRSMPANRRFLIWGLMLGAGIVTLIPYPAYFLLVGAELTTGPAIAALAGGLYGLARELPALTVLVRPQGPEKTMDLLSRLRVAWRRFHLVFAIVAAVALVLGAL